jgi:hypothetical protein
MPKITKKARAMTHKEKRIRAYARGFARKHNVKIHFRCTSRHKRGHYSYKTNVQTREVTSRWIGVNLRVLRRHPFWQTKATLNHELAHWRDHDEHIASGRYRPYLSEKIAQKAALLALNPTQREKFLEANAPVVKAVRDAAADLGLGAYEDGGRGFTIFGVEG